MVKLLDVVTVADAAMVNPWNVSVPEFAMDDPLFIVIVPPVGASVVEPLTVKVPPTDKTRCRLRRWSAGNGESLKCRRGTERNVHAVPVMVMVPPLGLKTALAPVVSAPAMLKLLDVVTVAEAAMLRSVECQCS